MDSVNVLLWLCISCDAISAGIATTNVSSSSFNGGSFSTSSLSFEHPVIINILNTPMTTIGNQNRFMNQCLPTIFYELNEFHNCHPTFYICSMKITHVYNTINHFYLI